MNWYVLFVKAGQEQKVEVLLNKWLDRKVFTPFILLQQKLFKIGGIEKLELKPLFPGYVFIKSEVSGLEFIKSINKYISDSYDIIRILKYSDTEIAMRECEQNMLLKLCNNNCIEVSNGVKDGNKINITDGPLRGLESMVRKIDRHKRQAWIEMEVMGSTRLISMALEIKNGTKR